MHIRYNNTNKYWEKSTDMSTWTFVEESLPFDADIRFGSTGAANVVGGTDRHFNFDGQSKLAYLNLGSTQTGTTAFTGILAFYNRTIAAADKRNVALAAANDGATNSGKLEIYIWLAGAAARTGAFLADRSVLLGPGALATTVVAGFVYIPTCAGVPTGVPTAQTGFVPMIYDTTNLRLYIYAAGAWRIH